MADDAAAGSADAGAVNVARQVKLPPFWTEDPEIWNIFSGLNITQSRVKYNHVLPLLPCSVLASIRDVVVATASRDAEDPYADLCAHLVGSFTPRKWQLGHKILHFPDIGDRRPIQLMSELLALLPEGEPLGFLIQAVLLERLPKDMREKLGTLKFETPRAMAEHGDLIWDAGLDHGAPSISTVRSTSPGCSSFFSPPRRPMSRGRRCGRAATPGPAGHSTGPGKSLSNYHDRWRPAAHRCVPPCAWPGNSPAGGGNHWHPCCPAALYFIFGILFLATASL